MVRPFAAPLGLFFSAARSLLLSRCLVRVLLGVVRLGNAANRLNFPNGRVRRGVPPRIPAGHDVPQALTASPLPQALILTAIVISFSFFAFLLVLVYRAYQDLGTDNGNEMRLAEPENDPLPPTGY